MTNDKLPDNIKRDRLIAVIVTALSFLIFCFMALLLQGRAPLRVVNCPRTSSIGAQSLDGHSVENQIVMIGSAQAMAGVVSKVPTLTLQSAGKLRA